MISDLHTHTLFSPDGKNTLEEMAAEAERRNLRYYGVCEHFDYDALSPLHYAAGGGPFETTDPEAYFPFARALQKTLRAENFRLLVGAEFGYCPDPCVQARLAALHARFRPDYVVNSVHIIDGCDLSFPDYFRGREKHAAYERYLLRVRESLDAAYPYDVVGHVGYPSRNAPYADRRLRYAEFADLFDDILRTVIRKGKLLEVNSSAGEERFFPAREVLARYRELGGTLLSFGSDAHAVDRIGESDGIAEELRSLGFREIAVPFRGKNRLLPL